MVIPAFNAQAFLARAVRSALEQTYPVLEIIIVDDGSDDGTREVARTLEREHGRVKLIALPANGGPSKARNAGIAEAKGDWIAVLDADDAYLPERLAGMMAMNEGADVLAGNFRYYDAKKAVIGPAAIRPVHGWKEIDLSTYVSVRPDREHFGTFKPMFRRAFLSKKALKYPEHLRHGEDFEVILEALAQGATFRINWEPGYLYTTPSSGWSKTVLDYETISASLRSFSHRQDLNLSAAIRATLRDRAKYARDQAIRESLRGALRSGKVLQALSVSLLHPVVWKFALGKLMRALRR